MKTTAEQDLDTIRILGGSTFRQWLASLLTAERLGWELVEELVGPIGTVQTRQAADADQLLASAHRLGWIERSFFAPSAQQQFAGCGGMSFSSLKKHKESREYHGQLWCWRALDRAAIRAYAGNPPPANLQLGDEVRYTPTFIAQIQGGAAMARARGRVVGYAFDGRAVRVRWDDDPEEERARESPYWDGEGDPEMMVPYAARAVMVCVVRRVGPARVAVEKVDRVQAVVPGPAPATATPPIQAAVASPRPSPAQLNLFTI